MVRVVNIRDTSKYDVDITRNGPYGNAYLIGRDGTREEVIELYRVWLRNFLKHTPDYLEPLRGKTLGCVCKPLPCHGDVIVESLTITKPKRKRK